MNCCGVTIQIKSCYFACVFFNISQREIWPFFRKKKLIVGPCRSKRREGGLGLLPGPDCDSP